MIFDLQFCLTVPENLRCETQIWRTVSKDLWRKRILILTHSVVMFVIWITNLYHGAENFERWSCILYHHVEISVRWITVLCRNAITSWDLRNKFVSQCRKFCGRNITNFSPNVELYVKRFKKMHHSAKSFDIWITSLSHSVEKFDKWSEILSCNLQNFVMLITILYTVPKTLRCDLHICLTIQNSLSGNLTFCTSKPKSLRAPLQFYLIMSTSCGVFYKLYHTAKKFENDLHFCLAMSKSL